MGNYDDIINLPHHVSAVHPRMSALDRAAQFSPFAALTGHAAAISETARLTEARPELDEMKKAELDHRLQIIREYLPMEPEAAITYFVPDARKKGGSYLHTTGIIRKLDDAGHKIILSDGTAIPMDDIYEIEGAVISKDSDTALHLF